MLRSLGLTYSGMEQSGIMMPVLELKCKYLKTALYDEEITINVIMDKMPGVKIHFRYELFNEKDELINQGETLLVFVNMANSRPCLPSQEFLDKLKPFFDVLSQARHKPPCHRRGCSESDRTASSESDDELDSSLTICRRKSSRTDHRLCLFNEYQE